MHPLVSFADPRNRPDLRGTSFFIGGDRAARAKARQIARAVGARAIAHPVHGPAYHAAAALVAGGAAALATAGVEVLCGLGVPEGASRRAVGGLLRSVADNVMSVGVPGALTGPVMRGDAKTVAAHRQALAEGSREAARSYDAVAPLILECARKAGLPPAAVRRVRRVLAQRGAVGGRSDTRA
jgi:predicted short-subunit dehydrogenase-like oxidoreductase (DUF2520 family)